MRCIKQRTLPPNTRKQSELDTLIHAYCREKAYWLRYFHSWKATSSIRKSRIVRDERIKEKYRSSFGLQARHWKLALTDAAETWDKYWKALFISLRSRIARHADLSEEERHYAYWLLKGYEQFAQAMQGNSPEPPFSISSSSLKRVARYIQRLVKQLKGKPPKIKIKRSVRFDANCYDIFEHNSREYISLMSLKPGKRIIIPLCGKMKISGTITLVKTAEKLDIHASCPLKGKKRALLEMEAVDFGYTEVMTDTQGNRYGTEFGKQLTQTSNWLHHKGKKRNRLHAIEKKERTKKKKKAKGIRQCNLGRKKHYAKTTRAKATLKKEINTGINQLIRTKKPSLLITEDLRYTFTFNKPKHVNRDRCITELLSKMPILRSFDSRSPPRGGPPMRARSTRNLIKMAYFF